MNLRENIELALEELKSNKLRSLLTMLGIIIGIASVILISALGNAITSSVNDSLNSLASRSIFVDVSSRDSDSENMSSQSDVPSEEDMISEEMISELKAHFGSSISAVGYSTSLTTGTVNNLKKSEVVIYGSNGDGLTTDKVKLLEGRTFTDNDINDKRYVAVIDENLAKDYFGKADPLGQRIKITADNFSESFTVVGVCEATENLSVLGMSVGDNSSRVYIPISIQVTDSTTASDHYSYVTVSVPDNVQDPSDLCKDIADWMNKRYYSNNKHFHIITQYSEDTMQQINSVLGTITLGISVIAGISLIVGGIGVMNIMLVSVTERTREIGIRKALGASNSDIRSQFIVESIIICIIGGVIGIALGTLLGFLAGKILKWTVVPTLSSIVISFLFSMAIGIFFGYYPADKAAKQNPIDALRFE